MEKYGQFKNMTRKIAFKKWTKMIEIGCVVKKIV